tara:strand:- start:2258 stop:2629 length:372 start_codon:yes stop_codon:yes gene_type:complete
MKKSDVKKWIKALRSGDYLQVQERLYEVNEIDGTTAYCCLGVACDLLVDDYWIGHRGHRGEWSIGAFKKWETSTGTLNSAILPTPEMVDSMGLDIEYVKDLADLNDQGWSFAKIADKIERDLL